MSRCEEQPVWFDCGGQPLLGIVARPPVDAIHATMGVVIVVGGPQYRAGSHRQFTLLARRLASEGFPTLRFDYRGMGDSPGDPRPFTQIDADIDAAVRALRESAGVHKVALWGLCDAASAALLAIPRQADVAGLVLVNPWVSDAVGVASIPLKYYYGARLRDAEFWRKLLSGKAAPWDSMRSLVSNAAGALQRVLVRGESRSASAPASFQTRMARGWRSFQGPILLALSGNDFTSRQFVDYAGRQREWAGLLEDNRVSRRDLPEADHTFSSASWRAWIEQETIAWLATVALGSGCIEESPQSVRT